MKDILSKLSNYNLFNYLLPGVIFVIFLDQTTDYNLIQQNNILGAFLYYFIGMVISRFGSLVVEGFIKKIKKFERVPYAQFIDASKVDSKVELLSEVNNTYRTLLSMMILLLSVRIYRFIEIQLELDRLFLETLLFAGLTVLFYFSYKKQTNYIVQRTKHTL